MLGWELPPHHSGGLGVACYSLSKALAEEGADIDFVVPYAAKHESIKFMRVLNAVNIDPLFRYGGTAYDSATIADPKFPTPTGQTWSIRDIQHNYCEYVTEYLETQPLPDVVHAHDWLTFEAGMLAKRKFGLPLVAHVHATEFDRSGMRGGNPLIHAIEAEALAMADQIIAVSDATRHLIHERYHIPLECISVGYNALDEGFLHDNYHFHRQNYQYIAMLKDQGHTIVSSLGRLSIQKGLWHFLRAAKFALDKSDKLTFVLAGDGEDRDKLMNLTASLGITRNVIFTGWVQGTQRRDIYSLTDVFVMSSISEPFGLTALEAAHHGNALILTKQSGVAEVLRSAMKYDYWDELKLADEILAISHSTALKHELSSGVRREYRRLSWHDVAKTCLKIYQQVARPQINPRRRRK